MKNNAFEFYHTIFTHLTNEEKITLYNLSSSLSQHPIIVEIGSYLGASSCFLAMGTKESEGHVYCVDTWENQEMSEGLRQTFTEFKQNTESLSKYITPLKGWSVEISKTFTPPIDMIFFDAGHSYPSIKNDWEAWSPKLKKNTIVVFHDIGWAEGVKKVVMEDVKPLSSKEERLPNMWWGWLK